MQPIHIEMEDDALNDAEDELFIEDFENDDVVYFRKNIGLAINIRKQSLLLFERVRGEWFDATLPLSDLRHASEIKVQAAEYYRLSSSRGARGIGEGVGMAIRNSSEQSKARRETGVELHFRSVERPSFLINIVDNRERAQLREALRQAISDGKMVTPFRVIPNDVREAYSPITQADIDQDVEKQQRALRKKEKTRVSWLEYLGIALVSLLATFPLYSVYKDAVIASRGNFPDVYADNAALIFIGLLVACRLLLGFAKSIAFRLKEGLQSSPV